MQNILKEIKNDFISSGTEPRVSKIEQYISQNKIFCILFYSKIIQGNSTLLSLLDNIINKDSMLKLLICICEENEEDYNKDVADLKNISCLILNFNSEIRNTFIQQYSIISLPNLIILDKNGLLMDSLNKERIMNLKDNDVLGWKNKFIIPNLYKDKATELGDKGRVSNHQHELIFADHSMKPGYGKSGWICDICRKSFQYNTPNFFCSLCNFDVCDVCYDRYKC